MPDEELIGQLNRLRARAGNPSVRELAQLTMRQGPGRAMSRSTVQDKISGKSPPRLGQILALVRACADYANSIGAPLDVQDTDEQVWRERAQAALVRTPASPAPVATTASPSPKWDLEPLIRAGHTSRLRRWLLRSFGGLMLSPRARWPHPGVAAPTSGTSSSAWCTSSGAGPSETRSG